MPTVLGAAPRRAKRKAVAGAADTTRGAEQVSPIGSSPAAAPNLNPPISAVDGEFKLLAKVIGCRPADLKMLTTTAGKELVMAAVKQLEGEPAETAAAAPAMVRVPDAWPFPPSADPLDALVAAGPARALQLVLWKTRIQNPEMSIVITPEDIKGFADCTEYLKVKPELMIWRRPAIEASPGQPATARRRAVAATPAQPAANFVVIKMVAAGTRDTFKPIENNEKDYDASIEAEKMRRLKQDLPMLAQSVLAKIPTADYSTAELTELCQGAYALARAS